MVLSGDSWKIFESVLASPRVVRNQESLNPPWPWTIVLVPGPLPKPLGDWSFFNKIRMCALLSRWIPTKMTMMLALSMRTHRTPLWSSLERMLHRVWMEGGFCPTVWRYWRILSTRYVSVRHRETVVNTGADVMCAKATCQACLLPRVTCSCNPLRQVWDDPGTTWHRC